MTRRLFCNIWEYSVIFCKTTKDSNVFNFPEKHYIISGKENIKFLLEYAENRHLLYFFAFCINYWIFQKK